MQLGEMQVTRKHELLKSLGVDPVHFGDKSVGYHRNLIADAFAEFKNNHFVIVQSVNDLCKDLGITNEEVYRFE